MKKLITGFFLCLLAVVALGTVTAKAASSKLTLKKSTTKTVYDYMFISIYSSLKEADIDKIEYKQGKVTKTADKYWKDADNAQYFYTNDDGKVETSFLIYSNATYSVRLTTKSGQKYVKSIKVKNFAVTSENSESSYFIKKISGPSAKGNYSITCDVKTQLTTRYSTFRGTKKGDTVNLGGGKYVTIIEYWKISKNNEIYKPNKYDDEVAVVVVRPQNPADFYDKLYDNINLEEQPSFYDFGFINDSNYEETLNAYEDYAWFEGGDYYVPIYKNLGTRKFIVTKNTVVKPAYMSSSLGYDEISGTDYMKLWLGKKQIDGIYIVKDVELKIYEKYDKKNKEFTDVAAYIKEIYMP